MAAAAPPTGLEDEVAPVREQADRQAVGEDALADGDTTTSTTRPPKPLRQDCGS